MVNIANRVCVCVCVYSLLNVHVYIHEDLTRVLNNYCLSCICNNNCSHYCFIMCIVNVVSMMGMFDLGIIIIIRPDFPITLSLSFSYLFPFLLSLFSLLPLSFFLSSFKSIRV